MPKYNEHEVVRTKISIPVRYVECDPMNVVHHSHYFVWYEMGRIALANELDLDFHQLPGGIPLQLPVVECSCRYRASARFGDTVEVQTSMVRPRTAKIEFTYRVVREQGRQLLAEAATSHVLQRADTGLVLTHLPESMLARLDSYLAEHSGKAMLS